VRRSKEESEADKEEERKDKGGAAWKKLRNK